MAKPVILLSIPALREKDVAVMPKPARLTAGGEIAELTPSFPCVTCPVQANMTTGKLPAEHGIVANGFYWRERRQVEMWTAPNDCIERPQIWDMLSHHGRGLRLGRLVSAAQQGCEADFVCTPAPIHNPDGSESLWCYTRPPELYGMLRDRLGAFPADELLGPAGRHSVDGLDRRLGRLGRPAVAARFLLYLSAAPRLRRPADRARQRRRRSGRRRAGRSASAGWPRACRGLRRRAAVDRRRRICDYAGRSRQLSRTACSARRDCWRSARRTTANISIWQRSRAFALVDHQFSHVFVADGDEQLAERVAGLFRGQPGIAEVLVGAQRGRYGLDHPRSGEVVLISTPRKLAGVLLVALRRSAPRVRPHGRHPPQAGLRSGGTVLRSGDAGHSARCVRWSRARTAPRPSTPRSGTVLLASEPTLFPGSALADTDVFGIGIEAFRHVRAC